MSSSRQVALRTALVLGALALTVVCADASASDIFDRVQAISGKVGVVKTLLIWVAFLGGLGFVISSGWDMFAITQRGAEAKWSGVGIKMAAGAILMGVTLWSGIIMETFSGTSGTGSNVNFSALVFPVLV